MHYDKVFSKTIVWVQEMNRPASEWHMKRSVSRDLLASLQIVALSHRKAKIEVYILLA